MRDLSDIDENIMHPVDPFYEDSERKVVRAEGSSRAPGEEPGVLSSKDAPPSSSRPLFSVFPLNSGRLSIYTSAYESPSERKLSRGSAISFRPSGHRSARVPRTVAGRHLFERAAFGEPVPASRNAGTNG